MEMQPALHCLSVNLQWPPVTLTTSTGKDLGFDPRVTTSLTSSLDQVLAGCLQAPDHSTPGNEPAHAPP
ncbi:hypothetical protein CRENBAI_025216 [Crenichthys baileyi]|uniref:Uncharacterized protein n=1 Tax=Crenichthys baileyi TaxID=28760 RepID=A0AAV9R2Q9_9TELE